MPLQKSFSELNGSLQGRKSNWQRSKSHPALPQQPPRPLPPVSESTKRKLRKFHFPGAEAHGKESEESWSTVRNDAAQATKDVTTGPVVITIEDDSDKENNVQGLPRKAPPLSTLTPTKATTPVAKLAWQDLIRMEEGRDQKAEVDEISPDDRILWDKPQGPGDSFVSPLMPRRGKKRARSSSPISSPANARPDTPVVNVKKLTNALKSPHADPAIELWDRFSICGGSSGSSLAVANPALAHLIVSSSPRQAKDGANTTTHAESSLRRALSCGSHWPKRRRIDKSSAESPTSRLRHGVQADSKSSMVSALLETVTGEIEKSNASQTRQMMALKSPSPRKRKQASPRKQISPSKGVDEAASTSEPEQGLNGAADNDRDSDYGDDDFDEDTLMELDATLDRVCADEPSVLPESDTGKEKSHQANMRDITDLDDEFGDMDDDLFAAAEDLIAEIESKPTSQHTTAGSAGACGPESSDKTRRQRQQKHEPQHDDIEDAFGDDFGGDFDFDAAELAATQCAATRSAEEVAAPAASAASARATTAKSAASSISHPGRKPRAIQRYLVTNVLESSYEDDKGRECLEKILVVQAERTNDIKTVHLRGDWVETPVHTKSYVHIIGEFEWSGMCVIDNAQNMLILHPDQLISSTVVADSFSCTRRAVLQDRVKATSDPSPALVYGTVLHEIFQDALMANKWDQNFLADTVDKFIGRHMENLYTIKVSVPAAREHLLSKMREMRSWAESFVSAFPKSDAIVQGRNGEKATMCVSKLLDVEEHVWSPQYGLKGNIDATVQVVMNEGGDDRRTLIVPFEVKTGKSVSSNHQAQTALYNLLLSDRYDVEIACGILYYMETSQTLRVPVVRHELRHMVMQRNQLACYVRERSVQLPPMKRAKNACGKCYAQSSCFTYHRLADNGDGETSGMGDKFDEVVRHLTPVHKEFFLRWEDLLTKEEKESQKLRRELWTMVSTERERLGRCFANVVIEEGSASEDRGNPKINRFQYTFIKEKDLLPACSSSSSSFSFLDSQLTVGEPIVVSDEDGHFALALGFVTAVHKRRISVAVDRRLHNARIRQPGFDERRNQVFASIMEVAPEGSSAEQASTEGLLRLPPVRYRLDKDEFSNGMATVRNNLVQVMADGPFGSREIRRLVVDLAPPRFKEAPTQYVISDGGDGCDEDGNGGGAKDTLNVDQKRAIEKVMSARDYALVLGMPGTGKTTTIAHIIRALIRQGKSVLLTSYTHTAVDNILLKLKRDGTPILRLGAPAKVHPEVQEFVTLAATRMKSFEEIRAAWHDSPVVATTCLGINHPIFNERTFDYCIVDEASQITLPICLGPIRMARTFVLVGDHNQLPPLVQNEDARAGGLDVSLFKLLSDTHPDSVVNLEHQYRMCEDVMALSNSLIYEGRLKCGTEELRSRRLDVPDMAALGALHHDAASFLALSASASGPPKTLCPGATSSACWLRRLVDPETRVAFVNTDGLLPGSREEAKGNRIVNPVEARVVVQLVDALLAVGVPAEEVGVMTHYRSQLALLKHNLARNSAHPARARAVEMHTADRFQGRDKEAVVLSLVRSNEACSIGDLLKDWRRINVAFTRAKTKLLVVGSRATLRGCGGDEMLARFVRLMEERDWVFDLPADALEAHRFGAEDPAATASSLAGGGCASPAASRNGPSSPAGGRQKQKMNQGLSPKKRLGGHVGCRLAAAAAVVPSGKENFPLAASSRGHPKKARIGERALLRGKPILANIFNEMMDRDVY